MSNSNSNGQHHFVFYYYTPSLAAAILFIILFAALTIAHIVQMFRFRMWFWSAFIIGGLMETIGYVGRTISHHNKLALGPFILQSVLLLVAPALFAASIYMTLGRITVAAQCEQFAMIPKRWLTKVFVCGDVIAFLVQAGGAGIMAGQGANDLTLGKDIILAGLGIQIIWFGFFVVVAWVFHRRALGFQPSSAYHPIATVPWQKHLLILYTASGLILIRSVFRIIEYAMGNSGYLMAHEVFLYVFDATLMFGVMAVFLIVHPSGILGKSKAPERSEYDREASMEPINPNK